MLDVDSAGFLFAEMLYFYIEKEKNIYFLVFSSVLSCLLNTYIIYAKVYEWVSKFVTFSCWNGVAEFDVIRYGSVLDVINRLTYLYRKIHPSSSISLKQWTKPQLDYL